MRFPTAAGIFLQQGKRAPLPGVARFEAFEETVLEPFRNQCQML
jgi:hypothetical protein